MRSMPATSAVLRISARKARWLRQHDAVSSVLTDAGFGVDEWGGGPAVARDGGLRRRGSGLRGGARRDRRRPTPVASVSTPVALSDQTPRHGRCDLETLEAAYTAAQDGAAAARNGDSDRANDRLDTATRRLATYTASCHDES
jgi:hypothetical protein